MSTKTVIHKKHLAIAISAALAGVSPMAYSACSPVSMTYVVDTATDVVNGSDGVLTFREALTAANANPGCDTITFDAALTGPIVMDPVTNGSRMDIADALNIVGPGSSNLAIEIENGGLAFFNHCNGDLDVSGITLDGKSNTGAYDGITSGAFNTGGAECGSVVSPTIDSVIYDDIVVQNLVTSGGGCCGRAISVSSVDTVTITNTTVSNIYFTGIQIFGSMTTTLSHVTTTGIGGVGIEISGPASGSTTTLSSVTSTSNMGTGVSLGMNNDGMVTITDNVFSDNVTTGNGGGLDISIFDDVDITISNTTINNNDANNGGGIYLNFASGSDNSSVIIEDSTISNNDATSGPGGGIDITNTGTDFIFRVNQSTLSGNTATGNGGGLFMESCCSGNPFTEMSINFSTITDNSGNNGGGIYYNDYSGDLDLSHTVIAGNSATISGPDYLHDGFNNFTNASYSFIGEDSPFGNSIVNVQDSTPANTSMIGAVGLPIDPLLDVLADNGGDTLTHTPLNGSQLLEGGDPTLQAGVGSTPLSDQRGRTRVAFTAIDIGAVEFNTNTAPVLSTPIAAATATIGVAFSIDLDDYFTDAEMDPITYSVLSITPAIPSGNSNWSIIGSNANGTFAATDSGTYTVEYQACDTEPLCTTGSGTLTIQAGVSSSSATSPLLAGLLATLLGLFRLRRK